MEAKVKTPNSSLNTGCDECSLVDIGVFTLLASHHTFAGLKRFPN